jgi:hypothetical protein
VTGNTFNHKRATKSYSMKSISKLISLGRAIAQAVSRWLRTSAVSVRARVRSCRIFGGERDTGAGFLRVLRFPLPILIPPKAPYSSIIRGWYNTPINGRRTKWIRLIPPQETKKNISQYLDFRWFRKSVNHRMVPSSLRI